MLANKDIICISDLSWDEHWGTEQQFMSRLCKSNRVLFINQPNTWLTPMNQWLIKSARTPIRSSTIKGLEKRGNQLNLASLPPLLPFRYSRLTNLWNNRQYVRHIRRWAKELEFRSPILWIYEPSVYSVPKLVDHSLVIYHCLDCWTGHGDWWNTDKDIARCEEQLVRQSDLVFTVSESLYREKARLNEKTHFIPNGADYSHFSKALLPETQIPEEMRALRHPIIGFTGMIGSRFDADAVRNIAQAKPDWSVVLVGQVNNKERVLALLTQMANVHFLGMQPIEKLPSYLKTMDVCLIPYKKNSFTDNCFPLKLFEYLAAGKPIVASDIPALRDYAEFVDIARTPQEYIHFIERNYHNHDSSQVASRQQLARGNSWENRVEQASEMIRQCVDEP